MTAMSGLFSGEAFASTILNARIGTTCRGGSSAIPLRLLDIFAEAKVQATFFMLGWCPRNPALMQRIVTDGHELASTRFGHRRVDSPVARRLSRRCAGRKQTLEDAGGVQVRGYRAPTFSIGRNSTWAHAILAEERLSIQFQRVSR